MIQRYSLHIIQIKVERAVRGKTPKRNYDYGSDMISEPTLKWKFGEEEEKKQSF